MTVKRPLRPFPQIPRYPGEARKGRTPAVPPEPPLEGAPQDETGSVFTPSLISAINVLMDYSRGNGAERRRIVEQEAHQAIHSPARLTRLCDSLALLDEVVRSREVNEDEIGDPSAYAQANELIQAIREQLDAVRLRKLPNAESMHGWVELLSQEGTYSDDAERVLRHVVRHAKSPRRVTDVMYSISEGALFSGDRRVEETALRILIGDTTVIPPTSDQYQSSTLAEYDLNDEVLRRMMEVKAAMAVKIRFDFPHLAAVQDQRIGDATRDMDRATAFADRLVAIQRADPGRYQAIARHQALAFASGGEVTQIDRPDIGYSDFLMQLHRRAGPVRRRVNEMIDRHTPSEQGRIRVNCVFPGNEVVQVFDDQAEVNEYILEQLQAPNESGQPLEDREHWQTLGHMVPEQLRGDWYIPMAQMNRRLIDDMTGDTPYLLSPRGDMVEITDPALQELGMQHLLYEMSPDNLRDTIVTLRIGNFDYRLLLDEHFTLRETNQRHRQLQLPLAGEFMMHVILSHMREILCNSTVNEPTTPGGAGTGARRAHTVRRPHRRVLPLGHRPTRAQIELAMGEHGIDLVRMNRDREARREAAQAQDEAADERWVTYVFPKKRIAVAGQDPVRSRAPEATQRLHRLLEEE